MPVPNLAAWLESASVREPWARGGDSWQRTEKPQQHIKEHQLGSSEAFMIPVVFWESWYKKKKKNPLKRVHILYAVFYHLQVQPGCCCQERLWTEMSSTTFMLLLLFVPGTGACAWVTPLVSYCRTNFEWREMAVKSFTNICNAIMLNYGWSTFA